MIAATIDANMKLVQLFEQVQSQLRQDAQHLDLPQFLSKYSQEQYAFTKNPPTIQPHDQINPNLLDPSEWETWDDYKGFEGNVMPHSKQHIANLVKHIQSGGRTQPVLVQGTTDHKKYSPMVMDGHHRTVANIIANSKDMDVYYDDETLKWIWHKEQSNK